MARTKKPFKVLSTLSLAASDAREDTLRSVILNTLYEAETIKESELSDNIYIIYDFQPHQSELTHVLNLLKEEGYIIPENGSAKLKLSDSEKERLKLTEDDAKLKEEKRFFNFKEFLSNTLELELEIGKIKLLYGAFIEYLYNSFYEFGEDAIENFLPKKTNIDLDNEDFIQIAYKKLHDKELCNIFKSIVDKFPDHIKKEDLEFLNEIASRTQSFASLGVPPEDAKEIMDLKLIDWILYLDTNVLYSLLDLHANKENESCKALIRLILDNKEYIKINLKYSDITLKELTNKKDDFNYLDSSLSESSIRGLLASDQLDDFSKQYYKRLLNDKSATPHPNKIIDLASAILNGENVTIGRNKARIEKLGEDFLNARRDDYMRYIDDRNKNKMEFCQQKGIPFKQFFRSEKQAYHDSTLRELILDQRSSVTKDKATLTFNNVKYFALTIDELLLQYDQKSRRDHSDERSFPVFFKPSFLLQKLVKLLPIKTDDYKKAFFKAITSRGFNKDVKKSEDIIKIVNYLKQRGIDNEEVIHNLIAEDLFLEKYKEGKKNEGFDEGQFIEDEINKLYKQKQEELENAKSELSGTKTIALEATTENSILLKRVEEIQRNIVFFENANKTLSKRIKSLEKKTVTPVSQIPFQFDEKDEDKRKIDGLKNKLIEQVESEIDSFRNKKLKRWQRKIWWNLFWVVPFTCLAVILIINPDFINHNMDDTAIRLLSSIFTFLLDGLFLFVIKQRYWDEKNKEAKRNGFPLSDELKRKLSDAKNS